MTGPFSGVRIIDFSTMVTGPLATMTLADQGADVIKVEPPQRGDYTRHVATRRGGFSASFLNNNRNKRSIVVDLKKPEGLETIKRLIAGADVIVQNFRPGVADRLGIGEEVARAVNPNIIYVSIAGFGFDGPYAQKPVFDPLIQATSGLTTVQAGSDEARPRLVRTVLPDKLTAIQASQAIAAALFVRERTGEGQHVTLSMLDTMISFLWSSDMGGHTFIGDEMENETAQSFIDLIYETADGYISVATMQDKEWQGLAKALDRPDLIDDQRFNTPELREINKDERLNLMQELLRSYKSKDVLARLEAEDVPCAPVLTRRDMLKHPQVIANDVVVETHHPQAGALRQARQPAQFSRTPTKIRRGGPRHGGDTHEVLTEAGFSNDEITDLEKAGVVWQASAAS
ncbi:MAG: CaiB/BaiF CoA-transferase family protein [Hyphomicrobiaceae bacterium]